MNLIEIQNALKGLPDENLARSMQQPQGDYPPFLILTEINRRKTMRDEHQARMATQARPPLSESLPAALSATSGAGAGPGSLPSSAGGAPGPDYANPPTANPQNIPKANYATGGIVGFQGGGDVYSPQPIRDPITGLVRDPRTGRPVSGAQGGIDPTSPGARALSQTRPGSEFYGPSIQPEFMGSGRGRRRAAGIANPFEDLQPLTEQKYNPATRRNEFIPLPTEGAPVGAPVQQISSAGQGDVEALRRAAQQNINPALAVPAPQPKKRAKVSNQGGITTGHGAGGNGFKSAYEQLFGQKLGEERDLLSPIQKKIEAMEAKMGKRRSQAGSEALMRAGLGMMASRSPFALVGIGEGGIQGLDQYQRSLKDIRGDEGMALKMHSALASARMAERQGNKALAMKYYQTGMNYKAQMARASASKGKDGFMQKLFLETIAKDKEAFSEEAMTAAGVEMSRMLKRPASRMERIRYIMLHQQKKFIGQGKFAQKVFGQNK